ncbi:OmpA family protein [Flavobacterium sp.]|uniref:OmpA family protein n=1 Tax=Flavobacterium sp. TaxID=239 RepID=UPI0025F4F5C9|nr:OmpA family protein [Flavobacterium sp.]
MQKRFLLCYLLFSITGFCQNKLDVFFDFNKDIPNNESQIKINQWVIDNKNIEIVSILGFCDSVDDSKYNKDLALRRVNTMLAFFNKNKVKIADKVELKSFGKDFNYSKNQSENRKVEVHFNRINNSTTIPEGVFGRKPNRELSGEETTLIHEDYVSDIANLEALVEKERSTLESKFQKAKMGDLIRISNINFYFNSERVMDQSISLLDELLDIMLNNPKLIIEIHGHICCNQNPNDTKLSYRRALVILKYLTKNGVEVKRLAFRGYGSNDPIYKLPEKNEKERAANRRVEILIVAKP